MPSSGEGRSRKLDLKTKLYFASGSLAVSVVGAAGVTTLLYYNQVLGVSAKLCGVAFLIASLADAVTDPLVGSLSDGWKSRWGRRHPFMVASAIPLAVCLYCTYQPWPGLSETGLFVWLTVLLVLGRTAATLFVVPHNAMGAEMTDDYHERTSVFSYNYVISYVGGFVFGLFVLLVVFPTTPDYANGMLNPDRYIFLASLCAIVAPIAILYCAWATRDQIAHLHDMTSAKRKVGVTEYLQDIWHLLHNRSYLVMTLCWFILATTGGILGVVFTYSYIYGFELSTEKMSILRFAAIPGFILMMPLAAWITQRLDKKYALIITGWSSLFFIGLPIVLRMLGLFPDNESDWLIPAFFAIAIMSGILTPVVPITVDSMMTDVADEHELRTGVRSEGAIFAVKAFAMKLTAGIGGMFAGFGLDVIGFPEHAVMGEVDPEIITRLLFLNGPLYWMICGVGYCFLFFYTLTQDRHDSILRELEVRRRNA
jgi:Na+/melibiose symporter-like transporter